MQKLLKSVKTEVDRNWKIFCEDYEEPAPLNAYTSACSCEKMFCFCTVVFLYKHGEVKTLVLLGIDFITV